MHPERAFRRRRGHRALQRAHILQRKTWQLKHPGGGCEDNLQQRVNLRRIQKRAFPTRLVLRQQAAQIQRADGAEGQRRRAEMHHPPHTRLDQRRAQCRPFSREPGHGSGQCGWQLAWFGGAGCCPVPKPGRWSPRLAKRLRNPPEKQQQVDRQVPADDDQQRRRQQIDPVRVANAVCQRANQKSQHRQRQAQRTQRAAWLDHRCERRRALGQFFEDLLGPFFQKQRRGDRRFAVSGVPLRQFVGALARVRAVVFSQELLADIGVFNRAHQHDFSRCRFIHGAPDVVDRSSAWCGCGDTCF